MAAFDPTREQERAIEALSLRHGGATVGVQGWLDFAAAAIGADVAAAREGASADLHADVAGRGYRITPEGDAVTESGLRITLARLERDGRDAINTGAALS